MRPKLIATNFLRHSHFVEPFVVEEPGKFLSSPYSEGDYFVSGLFCDCCDLGFLPDAIARQMGIEPCHYRGDFSLFHRPMGVGYSRSDASYDESGTAVYPFKAIIWQPAPDSVGVRVTIHAPTPEEAGRILVREHGTDAIYTMWNELESERLR